MMGKRILFLAFCLILFCAPVFAQDGSVLPTPSAADPFAASDESIFDDRFLIEGYANKIAGAPKDILLAMINDGTIPAYRKAAAARVFRERFASNVVAREKAIIERFLLRQLERTNSPHVQIEIMHTLVVMDRYRYFDSMAPALIQKIDHYDKYVADMAYQSLTHINGSGNQRAREARIEFNTLRKIFFLTRRKLSSADETDPRLKYKLDILRWSVKVLGTEELKNLPKEVLNLM
jgi:hypothetical protein